MRRRPPIRRLLLALLTTLALAVVVLNWTYGRLPAEPKPTGSFVQVGKLHIHYLERPGTGAPVVLIHGLPGTAEDFEAVTPLLAGHRTIAIDRPGFGYSTGGYVPFDRQLRAIHELLARIHITRPILVGHSYGGTIALGFAERYPSEARGLVLVDAAAAGTHPSGFERFQARALQFLQWPIVRQIADVTFSQLLRTVSADQGDSRAFHPQPVVSSHKRRLLAINMTHGNLEALAGERLAVGGVVAQVDRRLGTIALPTVVIQGDADELVKPVYGHRLAAALPDARLVIVGGGHMVPYTHPATVAAAVESISPPAPAQALSPSKSHITRPGGRTLRPRPAARSGA
jgi:pimeloyl-ACP methyl ester carboxylesterase